MGSTRQMQSSIALLSNHLCLALVWSLILIFRNAANVHGFSAPSSVYIAPFSSHRNVRCSPSLLFMSLPGSKPYGRSRSDDGYDGLGEYDPSEDIQPKREVVVGDPQIRVKEKDRSVTSILRELAAIQQQGPQKYCILGTRHCSYLHQQIIELLYV